MQALAPVWSRIAAALTAANASKVGQVQAQLSPKLVHHQQDWLESLGLGATGPLPSSPGTQPSCLCDCFLMEAGEGDGAEGQASCW